MTAQIEPDATVEMSAQVAASSRQGNLVRDSLHFLKLWLRRPASFGAVLPSGKSLARAMAAQIDPTGPGTVVELGGGTGSITVALLESGIALEDLVVIEREADLVNLLRVRFPGMRVISGDARHTACLVDQACVGPVKAVVSGLPLLSLPASVCREIITQAFMVLQPKGVMVQFTYGPLSPVSRPLGRHLDIVGERADWVLGNIPPASVWNYHRRAF
jgi:phosphatidylethanolamine/phosphatidyl-N-methylethanolamine N-methyltransferase